MVEKRIRFQLHLNLKRNLAINPIKYYGEIFSQFPEMEDVGMNSLLVRTNSTVPANFSQMSFQLH